MHDARLEGAADFSDVLDGRQMVSVSVGPKGEAILLLAADTDAPMVRGRTTRPGGSSFARTRTEHPFDATVVVHDGRRMVSVEFHGLELAFPHVQILPHDDLLIVGGRSRRFDNGTVERNAVIYSASGEVKRELVFGDGIEDVQTTSTGDVWVSYFDEGIFGNYGWGRGPDAKPVGETGLVRFDAFGKKLWEYDPPAGLEPMADCYALNVTDEATWAYYYTDFPLVRIDRRGQIEAWPGGPDGANAIAVNDEAVLLYGGYGTERSRCLLALLDNRCLESLAEIRLLLPSGEPVENARVRGRGSILNVFAGACWYKLDIADLY